MSVKAGIVNGRLYGLTCAYCVDDKKPGNLDVFNDSRKLRDHTKLSHGPQKPKRGPLALANAVWLCYTCRRVFFNEQGIATHQGRNPKCKGTPRAQLPNENLTNVHFDASEPDELDIAKVSAPVAPATVLKRDSSPRKRKVPGEGKVHFVGDFKSVHVVSPDTVQSSNVSSSGAQTSVAQLATPLSVPHKDVSASELPDVAGPYPWPRVADPPKKKQRKPAASVNVTVPEPPNDKQPSGNSNDYGSGVMSAAIVKLRAKMFEITRDSAKADLWTRRMVLDELDQTIPK